MSKQDPNARPSEAKQGGEAARPTPQPAAAVTTRRRGGPATQFGKQISSRNSLVHGLLSSMVVLPGENQQEFDDFRARLLQELDPQGPVEGLAADTVAAAAWRLRRVGRIESELFKFLYNQDLVGRIEQHAGRIPDPTVRLGANVHFAAQRGMSLRTLQRYESRIERSFFLALNEFQRLKTLRVKE